MRFLWSVFVVILAATGCSSAQKLDRPTALRLVQQDDQADVTRSTNHITAKMVVVAIPRALYLDPDEQRPIFKSMNEANLVFYRQLVAKGFLKEQPGCSATSPGMPLRKFYCFAGSTSDFIDAPDTPTDGSMNNGSIMIVMGRPTFAVTGVSADGNDAEAEVEIKINPTKPFVAGIALANEMDQKYPDLKSTSVYWTRWRLYVSPDQVNERRTRTYSFHKYDDGWRVRH